jgi:hypothetical protein
MTEKQRTWLLDRDEAIVREINTEEGLTPERYDELLEEKTIIEIMLMEAKP